jgi:hypothetical protein
LVICPPFHGVKKVRQVAYKAFQFPAKYPYTVARTLRLYYNIVFNAREGIY